MKHGKTHRLVALTAALLAAQAAHAAPSATSVDLSNYTLTGTYALPSAPSAANRLADEASAVTFNRDTGTLFVVGDGGTAIVQISKTGQLINSMSLASGSSPQDTAFYDPEGLAYIGGGQFVLTEERYRIANRFTYTAGSTLQYSGATRAALATSLGNGNTGTEGITYDPLTNGFIAINQRAGNGGSLQRIYQTGIDFTNGTVSNGGATTANPAALFNVANLGLAELSDVFALSNVSNYAGQPRASNILIVSLSGDVKEFSRSGSLLSSLTVPGLSQAQVEGITMDDLGNLYIVGERNIQGVEHQPTMFVYTPAPVPEPETYAMMLGGLAIVGAFVRRRNRFVKM